MENLQYSKILSKNWEIIALVIGIAVVLAMLFSLVQPFQYSATTRLLIIQKQAPNTDPYTATKAAERLGLNLVAVLPTSDFRNGIINSNEIIKAGFPQDDEALRKAWKKNVTADVVPESGILEIVVYNSDKTFASQLARSVAYTLATKGDQYHGGGSNVEIKVVDDVYVSQFPVRPNFLVNGLIGLILGIICGVLYAISHEIKNIKLAKALSGRKARTLDYPAPAHNYADTNRQVVIKTMHDHLYR